MQFFIRCCRVAPSSRRTVRHAAGTRWLHISEADKTRMQELEVMRTNLYPNYYTGLEGSIKAFTERYKDIENGSRLVHEKESVIPGRISSPIREGSKKLFFFFIKRDDEEIQVLSSIDSFEGNKENFTKFHKLLRIGDIVNVRGIPGKTKTGELSLVAKSIEVLAPCVPNIPFGRHYGDGKGALKDAHVRFHERHVDLLIRDKKARDTFKLRASIINYLRKYLDDRGFLEVETPILLTGAAGGAAARPFLSKSEALKRNLKLRVAPELYLKRLIIGGFDRVYEIGKVFRNEGLSPLHNPEFTMCELYQAYSSYHDLMDFTEDFLKGLAKYLVYEAKMISENNAKNIPILELLLNVDKFHRIKIVETLEKTLHRKLPDFNEESTLYLKNLVQELKIIKSQTELEKLNAPQLLDKLIGHVLEPLCKEPTFLCDHPVILSPLAKLHPDNKSLTERFELFINEQEICNAYTELNDPKEQQLRFREQQRHNHNNQSNDQHEPDADFVEALQVGLPPTAGWGLGIDRLVMLLSGEKSIKEVIFFPMT